MRRNNAVPVGLTRSRYRATKTEEASIGCCLNGSSVRIRFGSHRRRSSWWPEDAAPRRSALSSSSAPSSCWWSLEQNKQPTFIYIIILIGMPHLIGQDVAINWATLTPPLRCWPQTIWLVVVSHSVCVEPTMAETLVETLVDGWEGLQGPILTWKNKQTNLFTSQKQYINSILSCPVFKHFLTKNINCNIKFQY